MYEKELCVKFVIYKDCIYVPFLKFICHTWHETLLRWTWINKADLIRLLLLLITIDSNRGNSAINVGRSSYEVPVIFVQF